MTDELEKKIRCYEITPSGDTRFDSIIVEAKDSWQSAVYQVEASLEAQFLDDKNWTDIEVSVKCVLKTKKQLEELEYD